MWHLFPNNKSKKKSPEIDLNASIQQLRFTVEQLEKRETHLENKKQQCLKSAQTKLAHKDKKGAIFELKKKKMFENQLNSIEGKKFNLEQQILTIESAIIDKQTLEAMSDAAGVMDTIIKEQDVDNVEDVMREINEQIDLLGEINNAMSQPIGPVIDDAELEAELAELEELEELEADELLNPTSKVEKSQQKNNIIQKKTENVDFPNVPKTKIIAKTEDEDEELEELEQIEPITN